MNDNTLWLTIVSYIASTLLNILALVIVPRNRKPSSGMAWLLVIFLLPFVGWALFLILGSNKLPASRRQVQKNINKILDNDYKAVRKNEALKDVVGLEVDEKYQAVARLTQSLGRLPVVGKNSAKILTDYDKAIASITSDIRRAKESVYIGYYILTLDDATSDLFDALEEAKERGVDVKVLYDAYGSYGRTGIKQMKSRLSAAGIRHYPILPIRLPGKEYARPDLRNHRKIVVIDHEVGYTGSQNLIRRDYHRKDEIIYDELVVRLKGAIVHELNAIFLADWHAESGDDITTFRAKRLTGAVYDEEDNICMQMLPSGPGYPDENNLKVFVQLLYEAEHSIVIVNPYFVPPEPLMTAIVSAVKRGVSVKMINSKVKDQWMAAHAQRSYYEQLLKAGVEIYLYNRPLLLHSKYLVVDDEVSVVGSSNMDFRSFELISELSLICYDKSVARQLKKVTDDYIARSHKITLESWNERSQIKRVIDNLARLTSPLQ